MLLSVVEIGRSYQNSLECTRRSTLPRHTLTRQGKLHCGGLGTALVPALSAFSPSSFVGMMSISRMYCILHTPCEERTLQSGRRIRLSLHGRFGQVSGYSWGDHRATFCWTSAHHLSNYSSCSFRSLLPATISLHVENAPANSPVYQPVPIRLIILDVTSTTLLWPMLKEGGNKEMLNIAWATLSKLV